MPACDHCYRRKVRCEYEGNGPCSNCDRAGSSCTFVLAEHHIERRRGRRRRASGVPQDQRNTQPAAPRRRRRLPNDSAAENNGKSAPAWTSSQSNQAQEGVEIEKADGDDDAESSSRIALAEFHQRSINTSLWKALDSDDTSINMRIAYIGTPISNLFKLVEDEAEFNGPHAPSLHFPFPSIRPPLPWKPASDHPSFGRFARSFIDDTGSLPSEELMDSMIEAFFTKIHPGFPIIDEAHFRSKYNNIINSENNTQQPPALLLLQAVLLVGAHASDHPNIAESRSLIKKAIFRRAKALFDLHYENDRMYLVQAALLFTWHCDGADDVSANAYYWIGVACRIAHGLGMHRDLAADSASRMPVRERRIYRRIWWTLVQLDVLVSLHHGRPLVIRSEDCDQPPLQAEDFIEANNDHNDDNSTLPNPNINIDFCIRHIQLCEILRSILRLSSPGAAREHHADPLLFETRKSSIDFELSSWYLQLPVNLTAATIDDRSDHTKFWALQLQMHYNMTLLHLHRLPGPKQHIQTVMDEDSSKTGATAGDGREISTEVCRSSAQSIAHILSSIISSNYLSQCWFTCITSLLAAAIQTCHEARSVARSRPCNSWPASNTLEIQTQTRLMHLLGTASAIAQYWSSAEAVYHLYKKLLDQFKRATKSNLESQTTLMMGMPSLDILEEGGMGYGVGVHDPASLLLPPSTVPHDESYPEYSRMRMFEEEIVTLFGAGQAGCDPSSSMHESDLNF